MDLLGCLNLFHIEIGAASNLPWASSTQDWPADVPLALRRTSADKTAIVYAIYGLSMLDGTFVNYMWVLDRGEQYGPQ